MENDYSSLQKIDLSKYHRKRRHRKVADPTYLTNQEAYQCANDLLNKLRCKLAFGHKYKLEVQTTNTYDKQIHAYKQRFVQNVDGLPLYEVSSTKLVPVKLYDNPKLNRVELVMVANMLSHYVATHK